ncbi:hypothetical protein G6F31_021275 [Rhizopus arrhizus]|nr:hypothetical protein G6F31_021275 [Rhizopus arrhizus]
MRAAGRQRLHRRVRWLGSRLRPAAEPDEERRIGGPSGPRHARLHRRRHPGARLPDVRLSHANGARHRGRVGIRASII